MRERADRYDLVVIGMGSGGITAAEFAAELGLRVAAVERDRIGGDCLWTGCVPSKTLLASARVAHEMRTADRFGLTATQPVGDLRRVWDRIGGVQAEIEAAGDNPERFRELGIDLRFGTAKLVDPHTVAVGDDMLRTRFVLVATGSRPTAPPIAGLDDAGYLTNESVFTVEEPPASLVVVGGGPIALELAQGSRRLGVDVQLVEIAPRVLVREEPSLVRRLVRVVESEGVRVATGVESDRVEVEGDKKVLLGHVGDEEVRYAADEILVATGRRPNVEGLGLDQIGVHTTRSGIEVDPRLRSSVRNVYACGDVAGRYLFTHAAGYEGVLAVRNMFFPLHEKADALVPWCTFTDPELAHAGLTEAEARERHGEAVDVIRLPLDRVDRARAEGATDGEIILVRAKRRLVGAHVLAPAAGEIIQELALAIERKMKLENLARLVHVYPTIASGVQLAAAEAGKEQAKRWRWVMRGGRR